MLNIWNKMCVSLLALYALSACSFAGFGPGEVIERSRESAPDWVKWDDKVKAVDGLFVTVFGRSELANLPVGAKETQLTAFSTSEANLIKKAHDMVLEKASQASIEVASSTALMDLVSSHTKTTHGKNAVVSDIYYEKYRGSSGDGSQTFYKVYVRVDFPLTKADELMSRIGQGLRTSPHADLRNLGNQFNSSSTPGLVGH